MIRLALALLLAAGSAAGFVLPRPTFALVRVERPDLGLLQLAPSVHAISPGAIWVRSGAAPAWVIVRHAATGAWVLSPVTGAFQTPGQAGCWVCSVPNSLVPGWPAGAVEWQVGAGAVFSNKLLGWAR